MKCLIASFAILLCAVITQAQTVPGTKSSMAKGWSGAMLPVVQVPGIEELVSKVPAELWTFPKTTNSAQIAAFANRMSEWTKANANGKVLDISAVQNLLKPRGSEKEAKFILPSGKEVDLVIFTGGKGAPKVTVFSVGFGGAPAQGHPVLNLDVR